jgi:sortase B
LIIGIALLVIAIVIAAFLVFRYVSADIKNQEFLETGVSGLDPTEEVAADVDPNTVNINWDAMREINPDIVGFIMIPGTRVQYFIVQTTDNDYYLNQMFDKSYSENGAIFLDYESDATLSGKNNMIYGHNMLDGSMFAELKGYRNQGFFDTHRTAYIYTPEYTLQLEIAAVLICDAEDKIRQVNFADDGDYQAYLEMLMGYAEISTIDTANPPQNIYCLATCTDFNNTKRFVVVATPVQTDANTEAQTEAPADAQTNAQPQ